MNTSVHGHEVLRMMIAARRGFERDALCKAIVERFGDDARFDACAASGMTAEGLIDYLVSRRKLRREADGLWVNEGDLCDN